MKWNDLFRTTKTLIKVLSILNLSCRLKTFRCLSFLPFKLGFLIFSKLIVSKQVKFAVNGGNFCTENTLLLGNATAAKCKWIVWRRDDSSVGFGGRLRFKSHLGHLGVVGNWACFLLSEAQFLPL